MSILGLGGGTGRRLVAFSAIVTPAGAPAGAWTPQGWWRLPGRCLIERIHLILPAGVAGTLWLRPVYRRGVPDVQDFPLYTPGLRAYITGDDLDLSLALLERLDGRHEIGVLVQHTGAIDHAYSVTYEVAVGGGEHGPGTS